MTSAYHKPHLCDSYINGRTSCMFFSSHVEMTILCLFNLFILEIPGISEYYYILILLVQYDTMFSLSRSFPAHFPYSYSTQLVCLTQSLIQISVETSLLQGSFLWLSKEEPNDFHFPKPCICPMREHIILQRNRIFTYSYLPLNCEIIENKNYCLHC